MKKEYIKPVLEAHEIETLNLICESPLLGGSNANKEKEVLSKEREEFEEAIGDLLW